MNWNWARRRNSTADADDLPMAKAAAWAWYKHGSGAVDACDAVSNTDLSRLNHLRPRLPSRFKREAIAAGTTATAEEEPGTAGVIPLMDSYEIERITRELEMIISGGGARRREAAAATASPPSSSAFPAMMLRRKAGKKWARHAAGICGVAGEAVEADAPAVRRREKPVR